MEIMERTFCVRVRTSNLKSFDSIRAAKPTAHDLVTQNRRRLCERYVYTIMPLRSQSISINNIERVSIHKKH